MTPPVRVVCVRCAGRYALVVDPACPLCAGRGTVAVVVRDGAQPWVAARALGLHIGDYWVAGTGHSKVESARLLPLLTEDDGTAEGLRDEPVDRNAVGRAAGAWLTQVGLRKRKQRERKPRKTAAERAQERQELEEWRAQAQQRRQERQEAAKRLRIEAAALDSLRAAHPQEFEEMVEREGPLLVIQEMWQA
jgi:hypothetical protein